MAALNFPTLPTLNQQYPVPAIPGVPVYTWDGEKWTTYGASITNAFPATALPLMDATPAVVGITSKYAREDHVHPTDVTRADVNTVLVKSPQGLTPTEQTDVRKNVYAAPFDAMAYSGMQINGSFEVIQDGVTASTHNGYFCDGWKLLKSGTMVIIGAQVTAPLFTSGLNTAAQITVGTAQPSLGAGDFSGMYQAIEGYRVARLGFGNASAQSITIGFWSRHNRTGLYSGTIRNSATDRSYAFTYTQAAANVPQYNTVTIPGDTTGTWLTTNGVGMYLSFSNGCGTTLTAPSANTWVAGNYLAAPGQVNGTALTSDAFYLGGVVVLPGVESPTAARSPLIMRPYGEELVTCQRYYEAIPLGPAYTPFGMAQATSAASAQALCFFRTKRASPALVLSAFADFGITSSVAAVIACNNVYLGNSGASSGYVIAGIASASLTLGNASQFVQNNTAAAKFHWDARL